MPRKIRQLKAELRRAGFVVQPGRGKGSHQRWVHRDYPEVGITLAGHDGDDANHYQERQFRDALALTRAREEETL